MIKNLINHIVSFSIDNQSIRMDASEQRQVASFIKVWISTTIIMWSYVGLSYFVLPFPKVGHLGVLYSIIHTLTPFVYRYTKSLVYSGLNISLSGLLFQTTFCIYNGGIHSPGAIWFTIHPVIISFFASRRLILFSVILNSIIVLLLTYLGTKGFFPTDYIEPSHTELLRISALIGLDILIAVYTIVFINTTKKSEQDIAQRNEMIENLMKIIAHDIGSSLSTSSLSTKLILRDLPTDTEETNPTLFKRMKIIQNANNQIKEISNSITQWMQVNDNRIQFDIKPLSIKTIIEHIHATFDPILQSKNIDLKIIADLDVEESILADSNAFRNQIINNLLSNAIKFTPIDKAILINISKKGSQAHFSIKDEGIGIPPQILKTIFDPSLNLSRRGTQGEMGTGFGMPIVKIFLEHMKGSIEIVSQVKESKGLQTGSTVLITIPLFVKDQ